MHRTSTAPSPMNLFTTWLIYLIDLCKTTRKKKKTRPDLMQMISTFQGKHMSPRSKAAAKWLSKIRKGDQVAPKEPVPALPMPQLGSPLGSQMDFALHTARIEHVTDWEIIAKKYRQFMGYEEDIKDSETNESI